MTTRTDRTDPHEPLNVGLAFGRIVHIVPEFVRLDRPLDTLLEAAPAADLAAVAGGPIGRPAQSVPYFVAEELVDVGSPARRRYQLDRERLGWRAPGGWVGSRTARRSVVVTDLRVVDGVRSWCYPMEAAVTVATVHDVPIEPANEPLDHGPFLGVTSPELICPSMYVGESFSPSEPTCRPSCQNTTAHPVILIVLDDVLVIEIEYPGSGDVSSPTW
jgi:hypothetical protein